MFRNALVLLVLGLASPFVTAQTSTLLDTMDSAAQWKAVASDGVEAKVVSTKGKSGNALCLAYDFKGYSGYAVMQRTLPNMHPEFFQYEFDLRGDAPVNNLEFKLSDASGDNVWWVSRKDQVVPKEWTRWILKDRHFSFAWGPRKDPTLRDTQTFELTVSAGKDGGKGEVCLDDLRFGPRKPPSAVAPKMQARSTVDAVDHSPMFAVDGSRNTSWRAPSKAQAELVVDLGEIREFGGVVLHWLDDQQATAYTLESSDDGKIFRPLSRMIDSDGGKDAHATPESQGRFISLSVIEGVESNVSLAELQVMPLDFAKTPTEFLLNDARDLPRGFYPRGMSNEQPYWTVLGLDGGIDHGLIGEDGALELHRAGPLIEPFVKVDGKAFTWNEAATTQSLVDGYLPIPQVNWKAAKFNLAITAFVRGEPKASQQVARYVLTNTSKQSQSMSLALALRPLQVNPPKQFLSTVGGFAPVQSVSLKDRTLKYNDREVRFSEPFASAATGSNEAGSAVTAFLKGDATHRSASVNAGDGTADGVAEFQFNLKPGETREISLVSPLTGTGLGVAVDGSADAERAQSEVTAYWREKLDRVNFSVPQKHLHLINTLKTGLAHMLISRVGPRLQPGTRSYSRAWIRDGAMISEALLRMGREDVAREFLDFYVPYQFESGKVPCCVDDRGSDPVPENDSHGELIFNVAEVYRYTRDKAALEKHWPNVLAAALYMDKLRLSERTEANRALNAGFYGMMPASISHEGYSAKPMHSYWDNFWALRGYKDIVEIAEILGKPELPALRASRDQFTDDLYASIEGSMRHSKIDFIPGSAELGDFDATSTTIALAPGGEFGRLPDAALKNTFERYWREFVARRDGKLKWDAYTPYELRSVGAFTRMGWRGRANEALEFFFKDQQPRGWNQWAEVVSPTPRVPFFVGDLPHAWVESDYVRSALDMFAYFRESDSALVLAGGAVESWLDEKGFGVSGMRTPQGSLTYRMWQDAGLTQIDIADGLKLPAGGIVISWPRSNPPGLTKVNGKISEWNGGELRIHSLPARISVAGKPTSKQNKSN